MTTSFHNSFLLVKRPKSIYNQVKASLLKSILGSKWFEKEMPIIQLPKQEFLNEIKTNPGKREVIRKNVIYWSFELPKQKKKETILWATLFQVCVEFEFVDEWNLLWEHKNKFRWSEEEESLFVMLF